MAFLLHCNILSMHFIPKWLLNCHHRCLILQTFIRQFPFNIKETSTRRSIELKLLVKLVQIGKLKWSQIKLSNTRKHWRVIEDLHRRPVNHSVTGCQYCGWPLHQPLPRMCADVWQPDAALMTSYTQRHSYVATVSSSS